MHWSGCRPAMAVDNNDADSEEGARERLHSESPPGGMEMGMGTGAAMAIADVDGEGEGGWSGAVSSPDAHAEGHGERSHQKQGSTVASGVDTNSNHKESPPGATVSVEHVHVCGAGARVPVAPSAARG